MKWLRQQSAAGTVPALFLHIQKTAGTSLVNMARRYYGDNVISHADYCTVAPDEIKKFGFISGHFGYAFARPLMQGRYSFTFLRDPSNAYCRFIISAGFANASGMTSTNWRTTMNCPNFWKYA